MGAKGSRGRRGRGRPVGDALRVADGAVDLRSIDPASTPGLTGGRDAAEAAGPRIAAELAELQEMLFAEGRTGGTRSLLLVLQGMDGAGKGGTVRHVVGAVDPQGVQITGFKAPTPEELAHDFLWRIRRRLPAAGIVGVFDRSHYEDVVVVRVHDLVPPEAWGARYELINRFEKELVAAGTRVVKCFLHISPEESRERQLARLDDPTKHWKFNPGDIDERVHWDEYLDAYQDALERCGTAEAPWYIVPADRKWYRRWAVAQLLIEELRDMGVRWPEADFDVDAERARLLAQPF